jgi:hypothetical protein
VTRGGIVLTTARYLTVIGLVIGAIWAFTGAEGALLAGACAVAGLLVALVIEGRIDLSDVLGSREDPVDRP